MSYPQFINKLPIVSFLDDICEKLKSSKSRFLVLTAETAAGKSTALPVALLKHFSGNILMLEPRRLATVAIANRVSEILGEEVGKTVGYTLHLESKKSSSTRLEVVTEAILTRRLQSDPLLEDVNVVVLDEFHERSVHADLSLAFLKETMALRDDLYVVVMSATINYRSIAEYLSAEVMQIPGRQFPVKIEYRNENVENCIFSLLLNANYADKNKLSLVYPQSIHNFVDNSQRNDTILVFLPGIYEIQKVKKTLEEKLSTIDSDVEILVLHSSIPLSEQKKILSSVSIDKPQRIILSSAIAETSLTVPGVTTVVDSGLCRISRLNVTLGMTKLVTEKESIFSANQRSGRAGRIMEGKCIRLWDKNDVRVDSTPPEILRTDLTNIVLECAKWGTSEIEKLDWLTQPPKSAWNAARKLLQELECLDDEFKITQKGENALKLGLPIRLSCVTLCGEAAIPTVLKYSEYKDASPDRKKKFVEDLKKRLSSIKSTVRTNMDNTTSGHSSFLLCGYPDRIAHKIESTSDNTIYQFSSGRKATLKLTNGSEWIIAPVVDAGETSGKIYEYESIENSVAESWIFQRASTKTVTTFSDEKSLKMMKSEITSYGEIVLKIKKLVPTDEDFCDAVCEIVKRKGLKWLPIDDKTEEFLTRAEFYSIHKSDSDLKDKIETLCENVGEWLKPFLNGTKLDESTVFEALKYYLDSVKIDAEVPIEIKLPNGRKRKLVYEKFEKTEENGEKTTIIRPALEIIIQQIFGCFETPKVLKVPVLLRLLSPAHRPLQITDDLEHFWNGAWIEICKEMKGRYPKHNWNYRIAED